MSNVDDNDTMKDTLDTKGKRENVEEPAKKRPKTANDSLQHNDKAPNKKKAKKKNKPPPEVLSLRRSIQQCCATNDLQTAMDLYQDALSQKITMEAQTFYHLLNLCDGLGADKRLHIGTPKPKKTPRNNNTKTIRPVDAKTRQEFAFALKQRMDALKLPLNEPAYTALVRLLCKSKLVQEAEKLLHEAESISQCKPKLRLYSSLLITYCELGQMRAALKQWQRLSQRNLLLTEREYAALMQCAITTGNASIMERVLSDLAEDVLVPSHTTTKCIVEWFTSPHANTNNVKHNDNTNDSINDIELPKSTAPSMGPIQSQFAWHVSHNCHVDTKTGMLQTGCLVGHALQPVTLKSWNELKTMNETIVLKGMLEHHTSLYQGGGKGPKQQIDATKRQACWNDFQAYLKQRGHIDVVIDGANVGYYKQNFGSAPQHVDYRQIDAMVKHFRHEKKSILLVMHQRHFSPKLLPNWATCIVESWNDVLYKTPTNMNDDWFWLHAALQHKSLVVTNDEMRDHHFQMLSPRNFLRWKERHQVHFDITNNIVSLEYPDVYSRRIQRINDDGLVVPLPKRGDERRYLDGMHVAEDAPLEETYLCIRPKAQE